MKLFNTIKTTTKGLTVAAKHKYTVAKILTKKHAPLILAITAGVGYVATAVTAYQSAKKVDKTMSEFEERLDNGEVVNRREMAVAVAKDVATPVLLGTASTACLVLSYTIQNNRLKALAAALTLATEEHERYRRRAKEVLDEETFKKIDVPMETKLVETEDGVEEKNILGEGTLYGSWYVHSSNYTGEAAYDRQMIDSVYQKLTDKLMRTGVVMFADAMEELALPAPSKSLPFGWTDAGGFFIEVEEHIVWNDKEQMDEVQYYLRWPIPKNLYARTSYKDLLN